MAVQESFFAHLRPDTVMSSFSKISVIFPPHASTGNGFQHIFTAKSVFEKLLFRRPFSSDTCGLRLRTTSSRLSNLQAMTLRKKQKPAIFKSHSERGTCLKG